MTVSTPPKSAPRRPARHTQTSEERFEQWVTIGFVALIIAVGVIVVAALAYGYYDSHLKSVASVGGTGISRDQWSERTRLELARLDNAESQVRTAQAAGEIDQDTAAQRQQAITAAKQNAASTAIDDLIELIHQGQLAAQENVSVTDEEVDQALAQDGGTKERRRVQAIIIDPVSERPGMPPTPQERQAAYSKATEAVAALAAGTAFEEVARSHSTDDSAAEGGGIGLLDEDDARDPAWTRSLFGLEKGAVTPLFVGEDGTYRIGKVTEILPAAANPSFREKVASTIGAEAHRRNVRMEALAARLEAAITDRSVGADADQVRLAEILLEGDPTVPAEEDAGQIRASHILYKPAADPETGAPVAEDDPSWEEARTKAQATTDELKAIAEAQARMTAFAEKARTDGTDGTKDFGGDLGFFERGRMLPEFADPLFEAESLQPGDILGPVKTQYGWHAIMYTDRIAPLHERLDAVKAALAEPGADFAAVAREMSDGAEAPGGGELGWLTADQLDVVAREPILALEAGGNSEPLAQDDGYHLYRLQERATRPLDDVQRATLAATAFEAWYEEKRAEAEDRETGIITRDPAMFEAAELP